MAARAIGSGTITFGLVSIPVKLFSTGQSQATISFNLLHKTCKSRLKQQYLCAKEGVVVPRDEMVKGYEFAKDQYVAFTDDELKALDEQASEAIEITEFLPLASVDPVFFDKAYYLGPEKGADKAYRLLSQALAETNRAALAKYAARGKQYLVLLRPRDKGLVMQQLRYADEVKPMSEVELTDPTIKPAELALAKELIERGATDTFTPEAYTDDVKTRMQDLIQQKVDGQEISASPAAPAKAQIIDLMEALKASLQAGPKGPAKRSAAGAAVPADAPAATPLRAGVKPAAEKPAPKRVRAARK